MIIATTTANTISYLEGIGGIYKVFSIHNEGENYEVCNTEAAIGLVKACE